MRHLNILQSLFANDDSVTDGEQLRQRLRDHLGLSPDAPTIPNKKRALPPPIPEDAPQVGISNFISTDYVSQRLERSIHEADNRQEAARLQQIKRRLIEGDLSAIQAARQAWLAPRP